MIDYKSDIQNVEDIKDLVDSFYSRVLKDDKIGHIFKDNMENGIDKHLPKMYKFWESLLLDGNNYRGNPMIKHIQLDQKVKLTVEHFDHWISLWSDSVDKKYKGELADMAKSKAIMLKDLMLYKIQRNNDRNSLL